METALDPELPIIDTQHHFWLIPESMVAHMRAGSDLTSRALAKVYDTHARYLFDDLVKDIGSGHNIRATIYVESHTLYRSKGPAHLKSLGEVEFVNGCAAMSASGFFGDTEICAGIISNVDLSLGDAAEEVLHAHMRAGGERYRGIRSTTIYDEDPAIVGGIGAPHRLADPEFRKGFRLLEPLGLTFDSVVFEPQLPDVIDLARSFPGTQIILNHVGFPIGVGRYQGQREARFGIWRDNIRALAACENVAVKLGGLGSPFAGLPSFQQSPPASSQQLASEWKPYIETCIEAFGVERCMFESNYPMESTIGSYVTVWNAFKRLTADFSASEKRALFSGTASRIYRIAI
jgi:predicted TIM-barrel fold metal-dependent hydrolase